MPTINVTITPLDVSVTERVISVTQSGEIGPIGATGTVSAAGNGSAGAPGIAFASDTDTGFWRPGTNLLAVSTAGSERMRIDASGNVGIGTTNPANFMLQVAGHIGPNTTGGSNLGSTANRFGTLYVNSILGNGATASDSAYELAAGSILLDNNRSIRFKDNAGTGFSALAVSTANNVSINTSSIGGSLQLTVVSASGALQLFTNSTERMRIDASGNVGIGTTSPGSRVDISGGQLRITASGTYSAAAINAGVLNYDSVGGDLVLAARSSSGSTAFSVRTSNAGTDSEKFRILASGNVGIGTTNPANRLVVTGGANGFEFIPGATGGGSTLQVYDRVAGSYGALTEDAAAFTWRPGGTTAMSILAGGNVGIGTAGPGAKLHVSAGNIRLTATSDGSNGILQIQDTAVSTLLQLYVDSTKANIAVVEAKPMLFYTTNLERMRIDSAGNVGIGTTNPTSPLEIGAGFIEVANDGGLRSNISSTQRSLIQRTNTTELRIGESGGWTIMSFWPGSASALLNLVSAGNIGIRTTDQFGSGVGVIGLANAATVPTTNPTAAGVLYAEAGALKWRGSSGTITTIANA